MKVLIFGYGFIGKSLYQSFKTEGFDVFVASRSVSDINSSNHFVKFDVLDGDFNCISDINPTEIIYTISVNTPGTVDSEDYYEKELQAFRNVLDFAQDSKTKRIILVSSSSVYGNTPIDGVTESSFVCPINQYGKLKIEMEKLLIKLSNETDLTYLILRVSNLYGINQIKQGIVSRLLSSINNNSKILIRNYGASIRDFLYIEDFTNAIKLLLASNKINIIYNISSGVPTRITSVLVIIKNLIPSIRDYVVLTPDSEDLTCSLLQNQKFRADFNDWEVTDLVIGIEKTMRELL